MGENRLSDISKREADVGLRLSRSTSSALVEKRLTLLRFGLYASQEYVRRNLPSRRLKDGEARRHPFIGLESRWKMLPHEQWMTALGASHFPFRSSSIIAILAAVKQGVGLAALIEQTGRGEGLVRIEVDGPAPTQPMYLVYHRELRNVLRVRAVIAAIEAHVRSYG